MKNIKVGSTIYVSRFGQKEVFLKCPVCFGEKIVTLILGNGDKVEMPCECCSRGVEPSTGYVKEWRMEAGVESVIITKIETTIDANGETYEYISDNRIFYPKDIFITEQEAVEESIKRADKYNLDQETKAEFVKGKPDKNYTWNAGYHIREAKKAKEKVDYHTKMAILCKAKAKGQNME